MDDLYGLWASAHDASDEEIKRAYRSRARELHPDANGGDPESEASFKEVSLRLRGAARPRAPRPLRPLRARPVFGQGNTGGMGLRLRRRVGRPLRGVLRLDDRAAAAGRGGAPSPVPTPR